MVASGLFVFLPFNIFETTCILKELRDLPAETPQADTKQAKLVGFKITCLSPKYSLAMFLWRYHWPYLGFESQRGMQTVTSQKQKNGEEVSSERFPSLCIKRDINDYLGNP
jgi:hypothetical protein